MKPRTTKALESKAYDNGYLHSDSSSTNIVFEMRLGAALGSLCWIPG